MFTPPDLANTMNASNPTVQSQPSPQDDFLKQYQDIIAPYQEQAQRIAGGTTVFGTSPFATNHPRAAGVLSNLLLAGSQARAGQTIGDSIGVASRMALAPEQYAQQRQLEAATLPGKLMTPELQLLQHLSQMRYQNSEVSRNAAMADYYSGAKTDQANASAAAARARADLEKNPYSKPVGTPRADDEGHMWQSTFNPATGQVQDKPLEPVPDGYKPSFMHAQRAAHPGGYYGGLVHDSMNPDPKISGPAKAERAEYEAGQIRMAGGKTQADKNVTDPLDQRKQQRTQQHEDFQKLHPVPTAEDEKQWKASDLMSGGNLETADARWQTEKQRRLKAIQDEADDFQRTQFGSAPQAAPQSNPAVAPGPTSGGNSGWRKYTR